MFEVLSLLVGGFFFEKIHFLGLPLVILCRILRLILDFCLENFGLPGGVADVFAMDRAIQLGMIF